MIYDAFSFRVCARGLQFLKTIRDHNKARRKEHSGKLQGRRIAIKKRMRYWIETEMESYTKKTEDSILYH
jgi:hypothetical protein